MGNKNCILRIDLSKRCIYTEPLPEEKVLRQYVGGTGLALYYLARETTPSMTAIDPAAPLIFMTGPLAATSAPSSSNYVVMSLNYDVPYAPGAGHSHGYWAAYLKFAGYDGVIITGAADAPVYVFIDNGKVEIRDASHLWGEVTHETERRIKAEIGGGPDDKLSVACIGPGGEALLHGALIKNDRNHAAGKGSPGAVMGAKKLKAIAVRGSGMVDVAQPAEFQEVIAKWEKNLFVVPEGGVPPFSVMLKDGGITRIYPFAAEGGLVAGKNLTSPDWGKGYANNYAEACTEWILEPKGSFNCHIACAYDVKITSGPYAGLTVSPCGGGENIEGAAAIIGVDDAGVAMVLTDFYDNMGLESSTAGSVLGMAFEAYDRGILTKDQTGGLELTWGNHEAAMELLTQMIENRDFGRLLRGGMKEAAAAVGGGADQFLVHVKGAGINLHDWRPYWSTFLGQCIAGTGPSHQAPGVDAVTGAPDFGYKQPPLGTTHEGKALASRLTQIEKIWEDSLGVCWFACSGIQNITYIAPQAVAAATGWQNFTRDEALAVGERAINLMRLIAVSRGFKKTDDLDVSPRMLEAPTEGIGMGKSIAPYLEGMIEEYYQLMGWNVVSGIPERETIERLDLGELSRTLGVTA